MYSYRKMKCGIQAAVACAAALLVGALPAQNTKDPKQSSLQPQEGEFGKSYKSLRPEQKKLIDEYVGGYNTSTGAKLAAEATYDAARLSLRTTFDAVSHALLNAKLTDQSGQSLGRAIDVVAALDEVMGEEGDVGGDRQFRMYVYLKPKALDVLARSREFKRDRDNTIYHKGFPVCFRLDGGPPSIQFSISADERMADIDVDYRSSGFPKALFNGHLSAANSDVRAGDNLDRHANRWQGLNGWWRDVFGFSMGTSAPLEKRKTGKDSFPAAPSVKAKQGVDNSAHDFLQSWVVEKKPTSAIAYVSRRSYACLEEAAKRNRKPVQPGMVRVRLRMAMDEFLAKNGPASSVAEMFEPAADWGKQLKESKNAYATEFRLVPVPPELGAEMQCSTAPESAGSGNKEKYFVTAMRGRKGDSRSKVLSLLWTQESDYWKIIAMRVEDQGQAGITPKIAKSKAAAEPAVPSYQADPAAVKDITNYYETWLARRNVAKALPYVSERAYACLGPLSPEEKKAGLSKPSDRLRASMQRVLEYAAASDRLTDTSAGVQPVNQFARPVTHGSSDAFAIMAVPDQMAQSFTCEGRGQPDKSKQLKVEEARYGSYYVTASQIHLTTGTSPVLLLLWQKEPQSWKAIAWAVELP